MDHSLMEWEGNAVLSLFCAFSWWYFPKPQMIVAFFLALNRWKLRWLELGYLLRAFRGHLLVTFSTSLPWMHSQPVMSKDEAYLEILSSNDRTTLVIMIPNPLKSFLWGVDLTRGIHSPWLLDRRIKGRTNISPLGKGREPWIEHTEASIYLQTVK